MASASAGKDASCSTDRQHVHDLDAGIGSARRTDGAKKKKRKRKKRKITEDMATWQAGKEDKHGHGPPVSLRSHRRTGGERERGIRESSDIIFFFFLVRQ